MNFDQLARFIADFEPQRRPHSQSQAKEPPRPPRKLSSDQVALELLYLTQCVAPMKSVFSKQSEFVLRSTSVASRIPGTDPDSISRNDGTVPTRVVC